MKTWLRLMLVTVAVGGGFAGSMSTLSFYADPQIQDPLTFISVTAVLGLFAFVTIAGLLFVRNERTILPLLLAFLPQMPYISSPLIAYQFVAGFHFTVYLVGGELGFSLDLGSPWQLSLFQDLPWGFGVNLFAVLMFVLLARLVRTPEPDVPPLSVDRPANMQAEPSGIQMDHVEDSLAIGERVLLRAVPHWGLFLRPLLLALLIGLVLGLFLLVPPPDEDVAGYAASVLPCLCLPYLLICALLLGPAGARYFTTEFAVTDRRIIARTGLLRRRSTDLLLSNVVSIAVDQPPFGRPLNFGTIVVTGPGGARHRFRDITDPVRVRDQISQMVSRKDLTDRGENRPG